MKVKPLYIAEICHEANLIYSRLAGDHSHRHWEDADPALRASVVAGVETAIRLGEGATPEAMHQAWVDYKKAEGWTFGPEKDFEKKTHPNIHPYSELPAVQQDKDKLFIAIVKALSC